MSEEISEIDEMNDTSLVLPEGNCYLSKLSFSFECDASYFNEIQYLEYASVCSDSLSFKSDEELNMAFNEEITPSLLKSQNEAELKEITARKLSAITMDDSISSFPEKSPISVKTKIRRGCLVSSQPEFRSLKITMGSFNSVSCGGNLFSAAPHKKIAHSLSFSQSSPSTAKVQCCNCKKSKCLKLYCECFANGSFCQGCSCTDCHNTEGHQIEVAKAKRLVEEKNPLAMKRRCSEEEIIVCNCSRSACLKKYCECFKAGKKCGSKCNCNGCKNKAALRTISYNKYGKTSKKSKVEM